LEREEDMLLKFGVLREVVNSLRDDQYKDSYVLNLRPDRINWMVKDVPRLTARVKLHQ
jgi:hypothetical protein